MRKNQQSEAWLSGVVANEWEKDGKTSEARKKNSFKFPCPEACLKITEKATDSGWRKNLINWYEKWLKHQLNINGIFSIASFWFPGLVWWIFPASDWTHGGIAYALLICLRKRIVMKKEPLYSVFDLLCYAYATCSISPWNKTLLKIDGKLLLKQKSVERNLVEDSKFILKRKW